MLAASCAYQLETTGAALTPATKMPARSSATARNSASVGAVGIAAFAASAAPSASKNAPVKILENEWGSEETCEAGPLPGSVAGSRYVKELTALRRQSGSTASGC